MDTIQFLLDINRESVIRHPCSIDPDDHPQTGSPKDAICFWSW